jgi:hypothetical protein
MFRSCENKGFQLNLENGFTVSVQWGTGNYCEVRRDNAIFDAPMKVEGGHWESETAEVAAWATGDNECFSRNWVHVDGFSDGQDVVGWLTTDRVVDFIAAVAAMDSVVDAN